ncbi:hypothetical protein [Pseudomonas frederiksbergensis]|uniref:hypothetical protein n=1 Tax=Pseudomonas frederiksbergensis TaxID=104087 RepID=UPI003D20F033
MGRTSDIQGERDLAVSAPKWCRLLPVGAAAGCDLLTLGDFNSAEDQDQKIAAFDSSYKMGLL